MTRVRMHAKMCVHIFTVVSCVRVEQRSTFLMEQQLRGQFYTQQPVTDITLHLSSEWSR